MPLQSLCFNKCGFNNVTQSLPSSETDIAGKTDSDLDDDTPLLEVACMYADRFYGTDIQKVIIPTCDNNEINWDGSASEIMNIITDIESDSENETEIVEDEKPTCSLIEACDMVKKVNDFACVRGI